MTHKFQGISGTVGRVGWPSMHMYMWPHDLQGAAHPHAHICSEEPDVGQKGHMDLNIVLCVSLWLSPIPDL